MKRGIVLLLLLYVVGASAIVAGELTNLNDIKRSLGEPEVGYVEYFSVNAVRILTSPWVVVRELQEENQRLSQQWIERQRERSQKILESLASRGVRREGNGKTVSREDTSTKRVEEKRSTAEKRSARSYSEELRSKSLRISPSSPEARLRVTNLTLLRSYSELLSALEEKLSKWDFRGELSITNFNGSSLIGLSEEELLVKIEEQEERINELARQTGRRKIDYGGVEINRFRGDRYFVFLKKEFPEVTVAWRPLVLVNIAEAYKIIKETKKAHSEIMGMNDTTSNIIVYLWDTRENYHSAHKNWKSFVPHSGHAKSYHGKIVAHVSPNKPYYFSYSDFGALSHEFVHALDIQSLKRPFPSLGTLSEGFADYIAKHIILKKEPELPSINFTRATYLKYECAKTTCNGEYWKAYKYSSWFVRFLIENYGIEKFREIYKISDFNDYRYGWKYIDQKFRRVYGKGLEELDREMRSWFKEVKNEVQVREGRYFLIGCRNIIEYTIEGLFGGKRFDIGTVRACSDLVGAYDTTHKRFPYDYVVIRFGIVKIDVPSGDVAPLSSRDFYSSVFSDIPHYYENKGTSVSNVKNVTITDMAGDTYDAVVMLFQYQVPNLNFYRVYYYNKAKNLRGTFDVRPATEDVLEKALEMLRYIDLP